MDLTKYENQVLNLSRCIVNVRSAENHLESVRNSRLEYMHGMDHQNAIIQAKRILESAKIALIGQLRLNNMLNQEELR